MTALDEFAVTVGGTRYIIARRPGIRDDDTDGADLDDRLRNDVDRGEQPVDEIGALHQHLKLPAAAPTGSEKALGFLKILVEHRRIAAVAADLGSDDLAAQQRWPVMHG